MGSDWIDYDKFLTDEEIIKLAYQKNYIIPYKDRNTGNTTPTQI